MLLTLLLLLIWVAVIGFCGREGIWSNALRLVNVILAGLIAMNFFEPAARLIESLHEPTHFHADMAAMCLVFGAAMMVLRTVTDLISRVRVRFIPLAERFGGFVLAAVTGFFVVGLILTMLHTAPLARNFMWGNFRPGEAMLFGLAPDIAWLRMNHALSTGALARGAPKGDPDAHVFDPRGLFIPEYASRRARYQELEGLLAAPDATE